MPRIQKLHEQLKGRQDILVLSLNVDDNPALAEQFLRDNKYTFPVLLGARQFWERSFEVLGLPSDWLVNAQGLRSEEPTRIASDEAIARTIETLQKAAAAAAR